MTKVVPQIIIFMVFSLSLQAQNLSESYYVDAEFGITGGVAHYFGDLNNRLRINRPKLAMGVFLKKQFGDYSAVRISGHYARLGYSDVYNSNQFEHLRNLSFNTNIFEIALQGEFNFLRFNPVNRSEAFTPYASVGIALFNYNPYAYLNGNKYYLRPLHTEGQTFYQGRKPYGSVAVAFPLGFGLKYAINERINVLGEVGYRFTTTDYIDDVSTTYVGMDKFMDGTHGVAAQLQDRSYELGTPIGIEGRQRGFSKQKDQYMFVELGVSLNILGYRCPSAM